MAESCGVCCVRVSVNVEVGFWRVGGGRVRVVGVGVGGGGGGGGNVCISMYVYMVLGSVML